MASECRSEQCCKGFATFAADGQRKREKRRIGKEGGKKKAEGRKPQRHDNSIAEGGSRRNGRTL